jgi:hypothetical protein
MGCNVSHDQPDGAPELGALDSVFPYTINAVESPNMPLRKVIKSRGSFPNQEAAMRLLYLALEHIANKWTKPAQNWKAALQRFAIPLSDHAPKAEFGVNRRSMNNRKKNISGIGGSARKTPEIYRFRARIPGPGELRSLPEIPAPEFGARVASPQSRTLRSGPFSPAGFPSSSGIHWPHTDVT